MPEVGLFLLYIEVGCDRFALVVQARELGHFLEDELHCNDYRFSDVGGVLGLILSRACSEGQVVTPLFKQVCIRVKLYVV